VIGHCPEHLRAHPLVEWKGFIHKSQDTPRFLAEVDTFAVGCLPSYDEPLGISTLECLRLGIPVMGADVGGIPDCVPPEAGLLVPRLAAGGDIADALEPLLFDEARYRAAVDGAVANMERVTWDQTVTGLIQSWSRDRPAREQATRP
jgi:glycosyltransferase involved in cell wall biosynthesis